MTTSPPVVVGDEPITDDEAIKANMMMILRTVHLNVIDDWLL